MFKNIINCIYKVAVIISIGLTAICFTQQKKINQLDHKIALTNSNYEYYQSKVNGLEDDNRTLQLTVDQFKQSNDSILNECNKLQKELNIKDKNLDHVQVIITQVKDSVEKKVDSNILNFKEDLKLNPLTTITVQRKDSILTASLKLFNQQTLFVETKKEYRNKYRNGWSRFWHFDYKKDIIKRFKIHNSNDLIQVTDTRVVDVTK